MADNKHDAVWDWLMGCPYIQDLFFNFSQADDGDTQLIPSESLVEQYIDGSSLRHYDVALTRYLKCSFEPNDVSNINTQVDFDKVAQWVERKNESGEFPYFPEGTRIQEIEVLPNESGYMVALEEGIAKYMIQFSIEYIKEAK